MGDLCWTPTGNAFDGFPTSECANAGSCYGLGAHSRGPGSSGENKTGTLTSSTFEIKKNNICLMIGGFESSYFAIDINADGSEDYTQQAPGTDGVGGSGDRFVNGCIDVSAHIGQTAKLILVDNDNGTSFAWAAFDLIEARN